MKRLTTFLIFSLILSSLPVALADAPETFDLHAAFALTGVASSFGNMEVSGATLAIEHFNERSDIDGRKVRLVVEDTQSTNLHSLSAVRKLLPFNKSKIFMGPTWLDSFQSVLPLSDQEKILFLTPSAAVVVYKRSPTQYPLVFSTGFNLEIEIELLLKHMIRQNKRNILLAFDQDPFFQSIREVVKKNAASLGLTIVADESFDLQAADFRSMFAKTRKMNIDGAIFGFGAEPNLLTFLKQRRELAPGLLLYGTDYLDGYVSQENLLPLFDNVDYLSPQAHDKSFSATFQQRFKAPPVLSAPAAYDATTILLKALKANHRTPEAIRDYLLKNEFDTVNFGRMRFNELGGVGSSEFIIKRVRSKQIVELPIDSESNR